MIIEYLATQPIGAAALGAAIAIGLTAAAAGLAMGGIGKTCIKNKMLEDNKFGKCLLMTQVGESQIIYGFTISVIILITVGLM